jgi:isopentenyl-diphosphate delta-isomerase type 1
VNPGEASSEELVVLLDDDGQPCGTAPKATVHTAETPLHLAFSCWLFDPTGKHVLMTRRAAAKRTWPLVWTNSFCGHPGPGEAVEAAVRRRAADELGVDLVELSLVLLDFRYTARMANGVTENEVCPVFTAALDGDPQPDPAEVDAFAWVPWSTLPAAVADDPERYSPWMRLQLPLLADHGGG